MRLAVDYEDGSKWISGSNITHVTIFTDGGEIILSLPSTNIPQTKTPGIIQALKEEGLQGDDTEV